MAMKVAFVVTLAFVFAACAQQAPAPSQPPAEQAPAPAAAPDAQAPQPTTPQAEGAPAAQPSSPDEGTTPHTAQKPPAASEARRPAASDAAATAEPETPRPSASPASVRPSAASPKKPVPEFREVTIPAGTTITVRLATPLASDKSTVEDAVRGTVSTQIAVAGVTAIPVGSEITGTVREVRRSGRVKGLAAIAFSFERLRVRDESHSISTALVRREAEPDRSDDVKKGAIGGAAGAIIGGIAGGGKGAAIGAAAGGAGAVMATRGDEVQLAAGTTVTTTLRQPLTVLVPVK